MVIVPRLPLIHPAHPRWCEWRLHFTRYANAAGVRAASLQHSGRFADGAATAEAPFEARDVALFVAADAEHLCHSAAEAARHKLEEARGNAAH